MSALKAGDEEAAESAAIGMQEILEQTSSIVRRVEPLEVGVDSIGDWVAWTSEKIKSLRKSSGLTQQQLSEATGLPQSHISRLENGEHSPSFSTLEKLAKAFGVPVKELDPSAPD